MIDWNAKKAPAWFEHNVAKHYPLPRLSDADMIQMSRILRKCGIL